MSDAVATPPNRTKATKMEAVRQALKQLGKDASRSDLQGFVKQNYGFDMTPDHISNYKNKIQKKSKGKGKAKKPTAPKAAAAPKAESIAAKAEATLPNGKTIAGISLTDIEAVKSLVSRVGPEQLHSLVNLLAK